MIALNLETKTKEQERVKEYLENNVSETLAEKINNGVSIVKDGKNLISKKDLSGFIRYAADEARKQAEKGATCACIADEIVFSWAIHYFEEDSIEGKLFNQDGTEYQPPRPKPTAPKTNTQPVKPPESKEPTLLDLLQECPQEKPKPEPIVAVNAETGEVIRQGQSIDMEFAKVLAGMLDVRLEVKE